MIRRILATGRDSKNKCGQKKNAAQKKKAQETSKTQTNKYAPGKGDERTPSSEM